VKLDKSPSKSNEDFGTFEETKPEAEEYIVKFDEAPVIIPETEDDDFRDFDETHQIESKEEDDDFGDFDE
jgi:hypothetical protein